MKQSVAFLGLGAIGTPMASHIAKEGFPLTVWSRTTSKSDAFALANKVRSAPSAADAARDADVVVTCLPSSVEVEEVLTGRSAMIGAMKPGATLLDCTSGDPAVSRRLSEMLRSRGCQFVDAPVSGGVKGADAGKLAIMCGGAAEDVERVTPVLRAFGETIVHCGPVGAGHAVKALNQMLLGLHIWTTGEALAVLVRYGVDPAKALEVINASSGRSNSSMNLFPERVLTRAFPRTFKAALIDKDIDIAERISEKAGIHSEIFQVVAKLFKEAHAELGEDADHVEAVKLIEERYGVLLSAKSARGINGSA